MRLQPFTKATGRGMRRAGYLAGLLTAGLMFAAVSTGASATPGSEPQVAQVANCPTNFSSNRNNPTVSMTCNCPAEATTSGNVWGTLSYTSDSAICRSALHAGAVQAAGGSVTIQGALGCMQFDGTTQNGVTSRQYGAYQTSYYFPSIGGGRCVTEAPTSPTGAEHCPRNMSNMSGNAPVTCFCTPQWMSGSTYGTYTYTADSGICAAARHAGAVNFNPNGGDVTLQPSAGCQSYIGTAMNSVTSSAYGPYGNSFFFPSVSDGTCLTLPAPTPARR